MANFGIGKDIDEHRRHIRRDHPRAFGDARDGHWLAIHIDHGERSLGESVGRHDRLGGGADAVVREVGAQLIQLVDDPVMRQGLADHAG